MSKALKIVHWTPRILCILAILFLSLFALDAFGHEKSFWKQLLDFIIHLIPSFILLIILIISWKWELIGGIAFTVIGIVMTPIIYSHNYAMNQSVGTSLVVIASITFPFIVVGVLFILSHYMKKKKVK
ncbi:MAG: hypothetical protein HKO92_07665 [Flavobacteriaceae bacterium]|nr:hypothetical protein [Bacteroidia bacterium]NNK82985.1 hypothetical protein [Flavobacteriaceae bacterium]